ncbi:MAG: XRE family transcriptional regulator [Bacillota bacterium]|nr:MAG: XRE family transcriptional regulator [Bacillota bacterium]
MFGNNLKNLRNEAQVNQKALASQFRVTQATISSWENGRTAPSFEQLIQIADYFDVSVDYLIGRTNIDNNYVYNPQKDIADILELLQQTDNREREVIYRLLKEYAKTKKIMAKE